MLALSFSLAATSMLIQLVYAQLLAANLGGTALQYAVMVGLYTFSLGLGSLLSIRLAGYLSGLFKVEATLFAVSLLGYLWLRYGLDSSGAGVGGVFAYLPLICVGLLSGVELPILMGAVSSPLEKNRVLGADYFGMLAACAAFPLVLWPSVGVQGAFCVAMLLQLANVWATRSVNVPLPEASATEIDSSAKKLWGGTLLVAAAAGVSFCSLLYELALARMLQTQTDDAVLSQSLGIGIYLLGLGLGALCYASRKSLRTLRDRFIRLECALVLLVLVVVPVVMLSNLFGVAVWGDGPESIVLGWIVHALAILAISFLSGFELPLLLEWGERYFKNPAPVLIAASSLGGLAAGFAAPHLLLSWLSPEAAIIVGAQLNLLLLCLIVAVPPRRSVLRLFCGLLVLGVLGSLVAKIIPTAEQAYLKTHYYGLRIMSAEPSALKDYYNVVSRLDPVLRKRSIYQNLDLVNESSISMVPRASEFSLYINKKPQLSTRSWKIYHESYIAAFENLNSKPPNKVLILGGGDGVLAGAIREAWPEASLHLVELDPEIIELARTHPVLKKMNKRVFDGDLHVSIADAFDFIQRGSEHFEAIFLDFPYPSDYDVGKLYSLEFYQNLLKRLSPGGIVILDAPLWQTLEADGSLTSASHICYIFSTLRASGFESIFPFGFVEPLIAVTRERRILDFDYSKMNMDRVSNQAFVNLHRIHVATGERYSPKCVNSIYLPKRFEN